MHANVHHGAAAGIGLVLKPAAGAAAAPEKIGFAIVDFAQHPGLGQASYSVRIVAKAANEADLQQLARLPGHIRHFPGLTGIEGHGLFAKHMGPAPQRRNSHGRMGGIPGTHADAVRLFPGHQLGAVGINAGNIIILGEAPGLVPIQIAAGNDLTIRHLFPRPDVGVTDAAGSDNRDAQLFHVCFLLYGCGLMIRSPSKTIRPKPRPVTPLCSNHCL